MLPQWSIPLLLIVLAGCSSATSAVRLDTGRGNPLTFTPRSDDAGPVDLDEDDFEEAVAKLGQDVPRSAQPRSDARRLFWSPSNDAYAGARGRLGLVSVGSGQDSYNNLSLAEAWRPEADSELTRAYGRWCERTQRRRDCLHLLEDGPTLGDEAKRTLALHFAMGSVMDETREALGNMVDPVAVRSTIITAMAVYLGLWLLPEPVSKGVAATLTVCLIAYLGVDTVWNLIAGWRQLANEVAVATTFDAVRTAGEKYGKVVGENAARVFVMLATAAIGSTAGLAIKAPGLPGSVHAVRLAEVQGGFRFTALAEVGSVAVPAEGAVTITLAPGALAMAAGGTSAGSTAPVDAAGPWHHIASDKFSTSTNNGGPWTPRYQEIFDRAGMSLDDAANLVRVPGHKGPHPRKYHEEVYERLDEATTTCGSIERCREALTRILGVLARELSKQGTRLNRLVTRTE
ncbi:AHH domain-containing protein [Corallococcus macrosporus]|uniref:Putative lipoprotein n=1 Tax=Myxococcus fulvus (strain ATCC BAA-855 / HW-1) TaxID=483219 RepID=F8CQU2_MYXFH|nr:AHH domain-containing protein [Corallococcus macrosporus]AEI68006.1 putative lipoprotein [Corallococcus macrosporus]